MNFVAVGINHKTAAIEIREKFFLSSIEQDLLLSELKCNPSVAEAFVLSTCNRTEIYANVLDAHNFFSYFVRLLAEIKKIEFTTDLNRYFYIYADKDAVRHLFCVTSGIDSLVLGEKQILGQVKSAVERSVRKAMFAKYFNILTNMALQTAKKAHAETELCYGGLSVSWAAIIMAENLLGGLQDKSILVIGAGKMGEMAINQIHKKNISQLFLMNRTQCLAEELAHVYKGTAVSFCDIKEILYQVDVCMCASGAPHYVLDVNTVKKAMIQREQRPLVFMDISMPRNIDPLIASLENVHLSHIDDLDKVLDETMRKRKEAASVVEKMIERKVEDFYEKIVKIGTLQTYPEAPLPSQTLTLFD